MAHLERLQPRRRLPVWVGLLTVALAAVSIGSVTNARTEGRTQAKDASRVPAAWESLVQGRYENKGIAKVEKLGDRWVLSVSCRGVHTTYLDDTTLDLTRYQDRFVAARYDYIDRSVPNPRCPRAPCAPMVERRISLERITPLSITPEEARERDRRCE